MGITLKSENRNALHVGMQETAPAAGYAEAARKAAEAAAGSAAAALAAESGVSAAAGEAVSSAASAASRAEEAQSSASAAAGYAGAAASAQTAAEDAQAGAEDARAAAESARAAAEAAVSRGPRIENGTWRVWNASAGAWTDTGVPAQGQKGDAFTYADFTPEQLAALTGPRGTAGKSAYDTARDGGYTGTEAQFGSDLAGACGKYERPAGGIPEADLSQEVRAKLNSGAANALPLAGGTMQGGINMDGNRVQNLPTPSASGDAVPKSYADGLLTGYRTASAQDAMDQARIVRQNLLDNWYFKNPVNQREQTSWSAAGYTIDRWKLKSGSASVGPGGLTLNGTLAQIIPNAVGQAVVCSALLSDGTMVTPAYDDTTHTFTLTATGQTIVAAKLELGAGQTLAHQENGAWALNEIPDYIQELSKCLFYFERIKQQYIYFANGFGFVPSSGTPYAYMNGKVSPKRVAPIVDSDNATVYFASGNHAGSGALAVTLTGFTTDASGLFYFRGLNASIAKGEYFAAQLRTAGHYIDFIADFDPDVSQNNQPNGE